MRHLFAIGPALVFLTLLLGPVMYRHANSANGPITREQLLRYQQSRRSTGPKIVSLAPLILGEAGAIYFLGDSVRRKYRDGRAVALALSIMGLISGGITSLLYYAFWGHRPIEPEAWVYGDALCPTCMGATTDQAAPGSLAWNIVFGTRYMGSTDRCTQCNSVVRTLWAWVVIPICPLGSYRVVPTDTYRFIGRKTELNLTQVMTVYGLVLAVLAIGGVIYLLSR